MLRLNRHIVHLIENNTALSIFDVIRRSKS